MAERTEGSCASSSSSSSPQLRAHVYARMAGCHKVRAHTQGGERRRGPRGRRGGVVPVPVAPQRNPRRGAHWHGEGTKRHARAGLSAAALWWWWPAVRLAGGCHTGPHSQRRRAANLNPQNPALMFRSSLPLLGKQDYKWSDKGALCACPASPPCHSPPLLPHLEPPLPSCLRCSALCGPLQGGAQGCGKDGEQEGHGQL